jgi:hypothetical protein
VEQKYVKEIDFLPEWYKVGRKRKVSYKRQYTAITSLFVVFVAWSFVVDHSASIANATISRQNTFVTINRGVTAEYNQIKNDLERLKIKAEMLDKLSPKVNFANVVAELAFVVNENIMLSLLDIVAEKIDSVNIHTDIKKPVVKIAPPSQKPDQAMTQENCRFKVTIAGIAAGAPDVAMLISKLESSPYFCNIIPGFSKTKEINGYSVTEFEITCFIANYVLQK